MLSFTSLFYEGTSSEFLNNKKIKLQKDSEDENFEYYKKTIIVNNKKIKLIFKRDKKNNILYPQIEKKIKKKIK